MSAGATGFGANPAGGAVQPCPLEQKHWVEVELLAPDGTPMAGATFRIEAPGAPPQEGTLDAKGRAGYWEIGDGQCTVTFPGLKGPWDRA